jgi:hypothetical protein
VGQGWAQASRVLKSQVGAVREVMVGLHQEAERRAEPAPGGRGGRVREAGVPLAHKVRRVARRAEAIADRAHLPWDALAHRVLLVDVVRQPPREQALPRRRAVRVCVVPRQGHAAGDVVLSDVRQELVMRRASPRPELEAPVVSEREDNVRPGARKCVQRPDAPSCGGRRGVLRNRAIRNLPLDGRYLPRQHWRGFRCVVFSGRLLVEECACMQIQELHFPSLII